VLTRRCPIPVDLDIQADGRLPEPIEVAACYVVPGAPTNAVKHANAAQAAVEVQAVTDALRISVPDSFWHVGQRTDRDGRPWTMCLLLRSVTTQGACRADRPCWPAGDPGPGSSDAAKPGQTDAGWQTPFKRRATP
jgi:hypothetical protein